MKVISALARPHFTSGLCWCMPVEEECECCGSKMMVHKGVDVLPDERPRMSAFSDQRIWMPV